MQSSCFKFIHKKIECYLSLVPKLMYICAFAAFIISMRICVCMQINETEYGEKYKIP